MRFSSFWNNNICSFHEFPNRNKVNWYHKIVFFDLRTPLKYHYIEPKVYWYSHKKIHSMYFIGSVYTAESIRCMTDDNCRYSENIQRVPSYTLLNCLKQEPINLVVLFDSNLHVTIKKNEFPFCFKNVKNLNFFYRDFFYH